MKLNWSVVTEWPAGRVTRLQMMQRGALTSRETDIVKENIIDPEIQEGIIRIQTPAKPLSPPSGAPHPEQYPLVFPTEILITQNPPKLRKVSLKVLDSAGAAEQKRGDYRGEREPDENLFTDFSKTQDINGPH